MLQGRSRGTSVSSVEAIERIELDRAERNEPFLHVVPEPRNIGQYERLVKPAIDRVGGIVFSLVTLPILMIIIPMIWAKLGRPAIYTQKRVGRSGKEFTLYKLRTMKEDRRATVVPFDGVDRRINHKSPDDPRHVPLGRTLRKWSLDEIPQFWNVALGQMSLVGPRPELPHIVARYEAWQHRRHEVKPGITGLWQVSERGDIPMHLATDIDVEYIDSLGFRSDAQVLLRTIPAALGSQKGQ